MMQKLDKPVVVEVAYPGHDVERFVFTQLHQPTQTYYTEDCAAHISKATVTSIIQGGYEWLRLGSSVSEG